MKKNIEYYVNLDAKTVVCVLRNDQYALYGKMIRCTNGKIPGDCVITTQPFYKGIAKCSPNDEFDVETGKKIARLRALRARVVDEENALNRMYEEVNKCICPILHELEAKDTKRTVFNNELYRLTHEED